MGLFDIFKNKEKLRAYDRCKKEIPENDIRMIVNNRFDQNGFQRKTQNEKCSICLRSINKGEVFRYEGKAYCKECYNRKRASTAPDTHALDIQTNQDERFEHSDIPRSDLEMLNKTALSDSDNEDILDDITFIKDIKHFDSFPWHQFDILLDARIYGWDMMVSWADYMCEADLEGVSQVTISAHLGAGEKDITEQFKANSEKISRIPEVSAEGSSLSVAGISRALRAPMKIVWFNQTQVLRFFTFIDDEVIVRKYAETVIRRSFGTENEMKAAKPIPDDQASVK